MLSIGLGMKCVFSMGCHVVRQTFVCVLGERAACILYIEEGGSMFVRNVGKFMTDQTAS
jgi:hypothetical protein